ncbi:MAG: DUF3597 domain-containing protein [Janthinobacterium lividum]
MSFFGSIMDKIVHFATGAVGSADAATPAAAPTESSPASPAPSTSESASPTASLQSVDIGAVLSKLAEQKGGTLNYQTSIVDLLKLLDLDSSLQARKTLAGELDVHAGADGSAEENIALHKAVVQKLQENGGTVPDSMKG